MKNQRITNAWKIASANLLIISASLLLMSFTNGDTPTSNGYQIVNSKIFITGAGKINDWKLPIDTFSCQGKFNATANELGDISNLNFNLPINQIKSSDKHAEEILKASFTSKNYTEIIFTQKFIMILPLMKMAHVIGEIKIGNNTHHVPMQMQYIFNQDGSIMLIAKQFVKLSEFGIYLPNIKPGAVEDEITINIAIQLVKNPTFFIIAAN